MLPTRAIYAAVAFAIVVAGLTWYIGWGRSSGPVADAKSVAVLPFENIGGAEENVAFTDGIHDDIIAHLQQIGDLKPISRTSVLEYREKRRNLKRIAEELGVATILEGGVQRSGDRVRINVQLIDAETDEHLWAETYEENLTAQNVFAIQTDIAGRIASALRATLASQEREQIEKAPTENLEAYDYYVRGKDYQRREDYERSVLMHERAVELDSTFALAYANLAISRTWLYHLARRENLVRAAKAAADRAHRLDPNLAEAHVALGYYYYLVDFDYETALNEFRIAEGMRSGSTEGASGFVQRRLGRWAEALTTLKDGLALDPRNQMLAFEIATTHAKLRQYAEAEDYLDRSISLSPDLFTAYALKAALYVSWQGNFSMSRKVLQAGLQQTNSDNLSGGWLWFLYQFAGEDYDGLLRSVATDPSTAVPGEGGHPDTAAYYLTRAALSGRYGPAEQARAYYDSARVFLERKVAAWPAEPVHRSRLGVAYAGLGRPADAVREATEAVALQPLSKDAVGLRMGTVPYLDVLVVSLMVGEHDSALDQIELLLSVPSWLSVAMLRKAPLYDPLRDDPRFQALLEKYE